MKLMPAHRPTSYACARAALGLAVAACLLAVSIPARAGDDDVPIDTRILRSIMSGLGLKGPDDKGINYQERPPLVIPPEDTLPPPQKADAVLNNPAWPKDPDVERAKRERQENKQYSAGSGSESFDTASRPLMPDQLAPNAKNMPRTVTRDSDTITPDTTDNGYSLLTPAQLGDKSSLWDKIFHTDSGGDTVKFTGEPARTSLTEPPSGYQTPSPDQPYGNVTQAAPKPTDYYVEHGMADPAH
jgi:hypothetical protein